MTALLISLALAGGHEAPNAHMPPRQVDFVHLHLDLKLDIDAGAISGTATHTLKPLGTHDDWLRLNQVGLEISEVRVDGAVVEGWRIGHQTLEIPMPLPAETHEVAIDYSATPELGLHFRSGARGTADTVQEVWSQGQDGDNRYWIPSWDYPNDRFTYSAALTVPADLTVASNGMRTGSEPAGEGWKTETFALEQELPTYLIALVAGDYGVYTETVGEVTLEYLVPSDVSEQHARVAGGFAAPQLTYFNELIGTPYAWPIYRQAFVQRFMYGGMENTSLTINTDMVLGDTPAQNARAEGLVAHELAHQWFGDLVTNYGWRDRWLNEGFATMYGSRWTEEAHGRPAYDMHVLQRMESAARYTTPMSRRSWSPDGPNSTGVYDRGMMVLHMLRIHLGDDVYDAGIRRYVAEHKHQFVETSHLRRALEDESGEHLGWLFDAWVHQAGVPEIKSAWSHSDQSLTVTLSQGEETWYAPVEIEVGLKDDVVTRTVWLADGETKLVLDVDEPPLYVAVDPRGGVLARWDHTQSTESWTAQAQFATTPYGRLVAFDKLGAEPASEDVIAVLKAALTEDVHVDYRTRAARALGKLGTPEAATALETGLSDDDERMRTAVIDALGELPKATALAPLKSAMRDRSAQVRGAVIRNLAKVDPKAGLAIARKRLVSSDSSRRRYEHDAALLVLSTQGDASDLPLVRRHLTPQTPTRLANTAVTVAGALIDDMEDKAADRARAKLSRDMEPRLYDQDFRARQGAVRSLGLFGDDEARAQLLTLASTTDVERLAKSARDAAKAILNRGTTPDAAEDREDADALQQRLDELEERLDKLEQWR